MLRIVSGFVFLLVLGCSQVVVGAVFSYQAQIIDPPFTTAPVPSGGAYTGHLFLSDNNDYVFEFYSVSSGTKEQGNVIRVATETSSYFDTQGTLSSADNDSISMVDFDFEIDIEDEPTGKTFSFPMSGQLSGSVSFFGPNGQPYFGCTQDCYMADYVSNISFDALPNGGSVTMGNVVYQLTPQRQVVQIGPSSAGVESYLNFAVNRTELPQGDFDHDGSVTALDYGAWRQSFGQNDMGLWADADCNGAVDAADYVAWRDNFLIAAAGQSNPLVHVPEPRVASLLLICLFTCIATMRTHAANAR